MRSSWLSVLGAAVWTVSSLASATDPFTVGVLSCAAETNRDRRLECYDRAVANFTARLTSGTHDSVSVPAPPVSPGAKNGAVVPAPSAVAAAPATASSPAPAATAGKAASSAARHVSARIVSIDHFPDYVIVHLDNQQTWKQVSESSGGVVLRTSDPVTIDKEIGSWWLSGPKGEAVQVKLEVPKP